MEKTKNFLPGILKYAIGDATVPTTAGMKYLIHVCNDVGGYGAGFAGAIAKKWSKARDEYRMWFRSQNNFKLGEIQVVQVQSDLCVINMLAQHGIGTDEQGNPPIRYDALKDCLNKVAKYIKDNKGNISTGRFGSGLAGGDWSLIEPMVKKIFVDQGINVTIYDLPPKEEKNK